MAHHLRYSEGLGFRQGSRSPAASAPKQNIENNPMQSSRLLPARTLWANADWSARQATASWRHGEAVVPVFIGREAAPLFRALRFPRHTGASDRMRVADGRAAPPGRFVGARV